MKFHIVDNKDLIWVNDLDGENYAKLFVSDDHPVMMEAAELLKVFFEAKSKGISARLVCGEIIPGIVGGVIDAQRPKDQVIDQMNDEAANYQPCLNCKNPIYCQWGKKCSPGNIADSIEDRIWGNRANNMTLEQYEVFTIAHMATQIFANNQNMEYDLAVACAVEIYRRAKKVEL